MSSKPNVQRNFSMTNREKNSEKRRLSQTCVGPQDYPLIIGQTGGQFILTDFVIDSTGAGYSSGYSSTTYMLAGETSGTQSVGYLMKVSSLGDLTWAYKLSHQLFMAATVVELEDDDTLVVAMQTTDLDGTSRSSGVMQMATSDQSITWAKQFKMSNFESSDTPRSVTISEGKYYVVYSQETPSIDTLWVVFIMTNTGVLDRTEAFGQNANIVPTKALVPISGAYFYLVGTMFDSSSETDFGITQQQKGQFFSNQKKQYKQASNIGGRPDAVLAPDEASILATWSYFQNYKRHAIITQISTTTLEPLAGKILTLTHDTLSINMKGIKISNGYIFGVGEDLGHLYTIQMSLSGFNLIDVVKHEFDSTVSIRTLYVQLSAGTSTLYTVMSRDIDGLKRGVVLKLPSTSGTFGQAMCDSLQPGSIMDEITTGNTFTVTYSSSGSYVEKTTTLFYDIATNPTPENNIEISSLAISTDLSNVDSSIIQREDLMGCVLPDPYILNDVDSDISVTVTGTLNYAVTNPVFSHCWGNDVTISITYDVESNDFTTITSNGSFTFNPTMNSQEGTYQYFVNAVAHYLSQSATGQASGTLTVNPNERPEFLSDLSDKQILQYHDLIWSTPSIYDTEGNSFQVSVNWGSFPSSDGVYTVQGDKVNFDINPNTYGTYTVNTKLGDIGNPISEAGYSGYDYTITVSQNYAPYATNTDQSIYVDLVAYRSHAISIFVHDSNTIEDPSIYLNGFEGPASQYLRVDYSSSDEYEIKMVNPPNGATGETSMHFTLDDHYSDPVSYTIHWNIIENEPPSYSGDSPISHEYTAYFDEEIDFSGDFSDPEGVGYTISEQGAPDFVTLSIADETFYISTDNSDASTAYYTWSLIATDDESGSTTVVPVKVLIEYNYPPSYSGYTDPYLSTQVTRSDTYSISTATDPESESITYSYDGDGPTWVQFDSANREFYIDADATSNADVGSHSFHFTVSDGHGTNTYLINWEILPNQAPSIWTQPNESVLAYHYWERDVSIIDADGDSFTTELTTQAPVSLSGDTTIQITQASNADVGTYTIAISADDGIYSSTQSFTFDVIYNNPPELPCLIEEVIQVAYRKNQVVEIPVSVDSYHTQYGESIFNTVFVDGSSTNYPHWLSITEVDGLTSVDPPVTIKLSIKQDSMPTNSDVDSYQFKIESSDGHNKDTALFKWYILTNEAPVNPSVSDRTFTAHYSDSVTLQDEKDLGFDKEDDPASYWIDVDGSDISSQTLIQFNPTTQQFYISSTSNSDVGTYHVKVTTDDTFNQKITSFDWTIETNDPPSFESVSDGTVKAFYSTQYTYTVTELEGESFTQSFFIDGTAVPAGTNVGGVKWNSNTRTVSVVDTDNDDVGTYQYKVKATDVWGNSEYVTWSHTVQRNYSPTMDSLSDVSYYAYQNQNIVFTPRDQEEQSLLVWVIVNEWDVESHTVYQASHFVEEGVQFNFSMLGGQGQADNSDVNDYRVQIGVFDQRQDPTVQTFKYTVKHNYPPQIDYEIQDSEVYAFHNLHVRITDPYDLEDDDINVSIIGDGPNLEDHVSFYYQGSDYYITLTTPFTNADVGSWAYHYVADDGHNTASYDFDITIKHNYSPNIQSQADIQVYAWQPFTKQFQEGDITDLEDEDRLQAQIDIIAYNDQSLPQGWTNPEWLTVGLDTGIQITGPNYPTNDNLGKYLIKLSATDTFQWTHETFNMQVVHNNPPVVPYIGNKRFNVGDYFEFTISNQTHPITDPEGESLSIWLTFNNTQTLPSWLQYHPSNLTITSNPTTPTQVTEAGTYAMSINAKGGINPTTTTHAFKLTIVDNETKMEANARQVITPIVVAAGVGTGIGVGAAAGVASAGISAPIIFSCQHVSAATMLMESPMQQTKDLAMSLAACRGDFGDINGEEEVVTDQTDTQQRRQLRAFYARSSDSKLVYMGNNFIRIMFTPIIVWGVYWLIFIMFWMISKSQGLAHNDPDNKCARWTHYIYGLFTWNMTFYVAHILSLQTFIGIFLTLYDGNFSSFYYVASFIIACLFTIAYLAFIYSHIYVLKLSDTDLKEEACRKRFGAFYASFKQSSRIYMFTPLLFILRNAFMAMDIVFLYNTTDAKVIIFIILNVAFLLWLLWLRPYQEVVMNAIVIVNEIFILGISFLVFGFKYFGEHSESINTAFAVLIYVFFMIQIILLLIYAILKIVKACKAQNAIETDDYEERFKKEYARYLKERAEKKGEPIEMNDNDEIFVPDVGLFALAHGNILVPKDDYSVKGFDYSASHTSKNMLPPIKQNAGFTHHPVVEEIKYTDPNDDEKMLTRRIPQSTAYVPQSPNMAKETQGLTQDYRAPTYQDVEDEEDQRAPTAPEGMRRMDVRQNRMPYADEPTYSKNNPQSLKDAIGIHQGIDKKVRGGLPPVHGAQETSHTAADGPPTISKNLDKSEDVQQEDDRPDRKTIK